MGLVGVLFFLHDQKVKFIVEGTIKVKERGTSSANLAFEPQI